MVFDCPPRSHCQSLRVTKKLSKLFMDRYIHQAKKRKCRYAVIRIDKHGNEYPQYFPDEKALNVLLDSEKSIGLDGVDYGDSTVIQIYDLQNLLRNRFMKRGFHQSSPLFHMNQAPP